VLLTVIAEVSRQLVESDIHYCGGEGCGGHNKAPVPYWPGSRIFRVGRLPLHLKVGIASRGKAI
jgi:hypothetical protein